MSPSNRFSPIRCIFGPPFLFFFFFFPEAGCNKVKPLFLPPFFVDTCWNYPFSRPSFAHYCGSPCLRFTEGKALNHPLLFSFSINGTPLLQSFFSSHELSILLLLFLSCFPVTVSPFRSIILPLDLALRFRFPLLPLDPFFFFVFVYLFSPPSTIFSFVVLMFVPWCTSLNFPRQQNPTFSVHGLFNLAHGLLLLRGIAVLSFFWFLSRTPDQSPGSV